MKESTFTRINNIIVFLRFVLSPVGNEYGIGRLEKLKLARRIKNNNRSSNSLSSWVKHLLLVKAVFSIPRSIEGDVVECGCAAGGSSISLSLACKLTNRNLIVCDSFEGLPEPKSDEKHEIHDINGPYLKTWTKGQFSFGLERVKDNIAKRGEIDICTFKKGFFCDSLRDFDTPIAMIFEDADLPSSVEDVLRHLWPKLQPGCRFYSDEPWSIGVVSLFYDETWWKENFNTTPPGFHGSGRGIPAGLSLTGMGYAKKL